MSTNEKLDAQEAIEQQIQGFRSENQRLRQQLALIAEEDARCAWCGHVLGPRALGDAALRHIAVEHQRDVCPLHPMRALQQRVDEQDAELERRGDRVAALVAENKALQRNYEKLRKERDALDAGRNQAEDNRAIASREAARLQSILDEALAVVDKAAVPASIVGSDGERFLTLGERCKYMALKFKQIVETNRELATKLAEATSTAGRIVGPDGKVIR